MGKEFFSSEKEMQKWLSDEFSSKTQLADLIQNIEDFEEYVAYSLAAKKIFQSFSHSLKSLYNTSVISEDENISFKIGDSLKPDFLLYALETESVVIVEIKNSGHATREGGTELGAYASEVKSYVPFISDGDIVNVIISPEWPTLIRHYVFHEIFWVQRNLICLEPVKIDDKIKLKIVDIDSIIEDNLSLKIGYQHLGGYQLCLYDYNLYSEPDNRTRLDAHLEQMNTAISAMATKGNSQRNHGFAFLWKDNWELSLAPYSITIINFSPFQSLERLFHDENFEPNSITERFVDIIKDFDPNGHGESLLSITETGREFLEEFCEPRMEGFHTWDILKQTMLGRSDLISFHSWGVFGELYSDRLQEKYKEGNFNLKSNDPELGLELLDELIDPNYEFINLAYYDYDPDEDDSFFRAFEELFDENDDIEDDGEDIPL
ncbi:hypothetical protein J1N09_13735 [Aureitalea sp. L0-47]|uniref:hypothetical protein n=1 Tax=Aureitalea sp. L0-47 TaxID=2816962 RepID=UPI0022382923|nr:hypothetical protein [Aureitalea sp. L0-47]MCW5520905.1 hypothetical protein [Aureitalea sp. L0-47]